MDTIDQSPGGSLRSPSTPSDTPRDDKGFSNGRRILDQRRQLVMQMLQEHGMFPTGKSWLNLIEICLALVSPLFIFKRKLSLIGNLCIVRQWND